jgi:hypothetical protein
MCRGVSAPRVGGVVAASPTALVGRGCMPVILRLAGAGLGDEVRILFVQVPVISSDGGDQIAAEQKG